MKGKGDGMPGAPGSEQITQDRVATVEPSPSGENIARSEASPGGTPGSGSPGAAAGGGAAPGSLAPGSPQALGSAGEPIGLGDVFFDFDQYTIRSDAHPVLEANARWIRSEGKTVVIEGHCDERGTLAYNLVLGEKRALSAKRYLEDLGVPAARIKTTSYGEVRPFCKDHNEGCWSKNRRAHFIAQ
jgi:peptidoglycan-associated lipoprotein